MTVKLSDANLGAITQAVKPVYDRKALKQGILHFGVGNFHRAHQAVYLDDLFNAGEGHDWAIVGTGVMDSDRRMIDALAGQDYLTTVVEQEASHSKARITGPMTGALEPGNAAAIVARLVDPDIRIVSLTITEGGYYINPANGKFDPAHPDIAADGRNPARPKTVFGLIATGLKERRAAGIAPFTVMSCDNIPHNGVVARNAVAGVARLSDPAHADWIEKSVSFPNGMVDRITPATGERERRICRDEYGIDDAWPVFCEGFKQWVLEDKFPSGRPALEKVGVQFVPDVTPYEMMKIRILNGGHAIIAYPAGLMDIEFVHEAMEHKLIRAFLDKVEREEIIPVVPPVPDTDLDAYFRKTAERFANPKIGDTVRRLCLDGSNRQPKFIIPSIADNLAKGRSTEGLALESALWCRYCYGESDSGATIAPNDPSWDRMQAQSRRAKADPAAWLEMADIYGSVAASPVFQAAFAKWLKRLWADGAKATLEHFLSGAA